MKKIILVLSGIVLIQNMYAQQRPYFTQYVLNNFIVNPAVAGIENYTDVKASHRIQWTGLDNAPVTTYLTVNGPIKKKDYDVDRSTATTVFPRGKNLMLSDDQYQPPDSHSGIGLTIINDRTGPLNRFAAYGTYAYHLKLNDATNLALGLSAGINQMTLNTSKLVFTTAGDPAIGGAKSGLLNKINPDVSAGLWLYSSKYFVGLAAQQIISDKLYFSDYSNQSSLVETKGKLVPHLFGQAGYRFTLDEDFTLLPSVMLRYVDPLPFSFDLNTKLEYQNQIWVGANYRYKDGYGAMLGLNINYCINIGYAYDYTSSGLNSVSKGTHEILVGFLIGNRYNDYYPKFAW